MLAPGFDVTFDGSGSYDTDIDDLGHTPEWEWDFDNDDVFNVDVSTTSALVTWQFSQLGGRTVAVRYTDNDGQTGGIYEFPVMIQTRRYYYIKDHPPVIGQALGSIRTTVDEDGNVAGYAASDCRRNDYYPFGLTIPGRSSNTENPNDNYKFTGYELDDEILSQLVCLRLCCSFYYS